jgi:phosphoribosyl 1,2-cyclic phosphodiesterase
LNAGKSSKIYISFWGTRGSISTPGRATEKYGGNTSCVSIDCQDTFLIFDAGTGIRNLGLELSRKINEKIGPSSLHLFLSHTHWDHIQGFPFFSPAYAEDTKLTIYGSHRRERFLASILKRQMDSNYFPVSMSAIAADIEIREMSDETISIPPLAIDWQEQIYHPGGSVRYRISLNGKKIVYATDVELNKIFESRENNRKKKRHAREYMDFIHQADLLIADGQYTEEEYRQNPGWGHTSIPLLLKTVSQAGVKQLAVFHHDPQHTDKYLDELWMTFRNEYQVSDSGTNVFWAREGMTLSI